jgi:hypothetical protein
MIITRANVLGLEMFCCAALVAGWVWLLIGFAASSVTTGELHKPRGMFIDEHAISDGVSVASFINDFKNHSCDSWEDALRYSISRHQRDHGATKGSFYHSLFRTGSAEQQKTKEMSALIVPISIDGMEHHIISFIDNLACMLEQRGSTRNIAILVVDAKMQCESGALIDSIFDAKKEVHSPHVRSLGDLGLLREAIVVDLTDGPCGGGASGQRQGPEPEPTYAKKRHNFDDYWSATHLTIDPVGSNGALPNMDAIAAFRNVYKHSFLVSPLESTRQSETNFMGAQFDFLKVYPFQAFHISSLEVVMRRTKSLLAFAASMITPAPSLHGPLLARNVDAFTIRGTRVQQNKPEVTLSPRDIADLITRFTWSLQSLHGEIVFWMHTIYVTRC